ncbi:hypothetical protein ABH940_005392 [Streptacidiphilus sp. BW17]|uniref:hypothetical protein n=1 Tax=Streptacidiphilus sp. BW17 TaxID=3156274 RepID=UPI003513C73C
MTPTPYFPPKSFGQEPVRAEVTAADETNAVPPGASHSEPEPAPPALQEATDTAVQR